MDRWSVVVALVVLTGCGGGGSPSAPDPPQSSTSPQPVTAPASVLIGSGDVGWPGSDIQRRTGAIVAGRVAQGATPFCAGDCEQSDGSYANYMINYDPFWGSFREATLAVAGNHEYESGNKDAFFQFFGPAADPDGTRTGWYIKRLPQVTVVVLNSNVDMRSSSQQIRWLRSVLTPEPTPCTVAIWHHPRWSSGKNGDNPQVQEFWNVLYELGADVTVHGHDHWLERMKPQKPNGTVDLQRGIRQFTAGGGGAMLYAMRRQNENSEFALSTHGVLELTFRERSYGWSFIDVSGAIVDSDRAVPAGDVQCH